MSDWVDVVGFAGGAMTVWAMYRRTMIPLRLWIVCANVALLVFGALAASWPTVALHAVLLPLNAWRLFQMTRLVRDMRRASVEGGSLDPLMPFMQREHAKAGEVLFRKDDASDRMILVAEGTVRLEEIDVRIGRGEVLGEIGAFAPDQRRTCTAICETDCVLYGLTSQVLLELFAQNPRFSLFLARTIVGRLLDNWKRADARARMS